MTVRNRQAYFAAGTLAVAVAWAGQSVSLREQGMLDLTPNIAALGQSPYGKTLGFAIQSPIDAYWHSAEDHDHDHEHGHDAEHEHEHDPNEPGGTHPGCADPHCPHEHGAVATANPGEAPHGLLPAAKGFIEEMSHAVEKRTSPYGQSSAHKRYIRRQIERKLATAYWLDPGNYANYNAYHLFLSESSLHTRDVDFPSVRDLADRTRLSVDSEGVNPEPWLTAASAMMNKMEILFHLRREGDDTVGQFEAALGEAKYCLGRYRTLRNRQVKAGLWEGIPVARRDVMESRATMLGRWLEAQEVILEKRLAAPLD